MEPSPPFFISLVPTRFSIASPGGLLFRYRPQLLGHPVTGTQDYSNPSLLQPAKFRDQIPPLSLHVACKKRVARVGSIQTTQFSSHTLTQPHFPCMVREREGVRPGEEAAVDPQLHREPPEAGMPGTRTTLEKGEDKILTWLPRAPLSLFLGTGSPWWLFSSLPAPLITFATSCCCCC